MNKRVIPLLVLAVVLAVAPGAMAQCLKCRPLQHTCVVATTGGYDSCFWQNDCFLGDPCGAAMSAQELPPLASEFQVASVERLDEPQTKTKTDEPRVSSLEKVPVVHR